MGIYKLGFALGTTIRIAAIGGQPYEAMYDSISTFEEAYCLTRTA